MISGVYESSTRCPEQNVTMFLLIALRLGSIATPSVQGRIPSRFPMDRITNEMSIALIEACRRTAFVIGCRKIFLP